LTSKTAANPDRDFFKCDECDFFRWVDEMGPTCDCGQGSCLRTSRTVANPGRQFYVCPKGRDEKCDFFLWRDEAGRIRDRVDAQPDDSESHEDTSEAEDDDDDESEPEVAGLTQAEIDALPYQKVTKAMLHGDPDEGNDVCTICLENFQLGERVRRFPCTHFFHKRCINEWLLQSATCPCCRVPMVS
jgi:hypothetical protein